ncbi:MAG: quinol oxidase [Bacteroides sp.]|nr:quinol oxidase [Bacteroides sp.]
MKQTTATNRVFNLSGMFTLALRLVVGWTYFSAFWRRLVLENKLVEDAPGYIGEKFNHFLPNALGIKPVIEYLVTTPDVLWWAMVAFTIIEGVVGFLFMLGYFTRLASIGVLALAGGILLGSGWLGSTCLDEWRIGILGVAAGFTIFMSGGGYYSLDRIGLPKMSWLTKYKWYPWITSGELPVKDNALKKMAIVGSAAILFLTLFTNQAFHGGVWGKLHNKSVKPKIEITDASLQSSKLQFTLSRVEGIDVYGSFLIGVALQDAEGNELVKLDMEDLAHFPVEDIHNEYIAKVKPGKYSLVIPLGAKATLDIKDNILQNLPQGTYKLVLTDISGQTWETEVQSI